MITVNAKRHLEALRDSRDQWIVILNETPDSLAAAQTIATINAQIQYLTSLKLLSGDYS